MQPTVITEEKARDAYEVLLERAEKDIFLARPWSRWIEQRWGQGMDLPTAIGHVTIIAQDFYVKMRMFGWPVPDQVDTCEAVFEVVGVPIPDIPDHGVGHGGR